MPNVASLHVCFYVFLLPGTCMLHTPRRPESTNIFVHLKLVSFLREAFNKTPILCVCFQELLNLQSCIDFVLFCVWNGVCMMRSGEPCGSTDLHAHGCLQALSTTHCGPKLEERDLRQQSFVTGEYISNAETVIHAF